MPKCECGCGKNVNNRFAQGHDAKLHSKLLDKASGSGVAATKAKAALRKHGWYLPKK